MFSLWVFALPHIRMTLEVDELVAIKWIGIGLALVAGLGAVINLIRSQCDEGHRKARYHAAYLLCGGIGLLRIASAHDLIHLMTGYGLLSIAWASISSTPYALVSERVTDGSYDRTMARFNLSVVIPQIVLALSLGWLMVRLPPASAIQYGGYAMLAAAAIMLVLMRTGYRD